MYRNWKTNKEIINVDYRGHWYRMDEAVCDSNKELYEDVLGFIVCRVSKEDELILFGHSMGGIVAWHMADELLKLQYKVCSVCVSACLPPQLFPGTRIAEMKKDDDLVELLLENQQVSQRIVETSVFRAIMLPIIKNDIHLCQTYRQGFTNRHVNIPVMLLGGREDALVNSEQMLEWKKCANVKNVFMFDGGHFYFKDDIICKQVCAILDSL